jgi:hypothetical protein
MVLVKNNMKRKNGEYSAGGVYLSPDATPSLARYFVMARC